MFYRRDWWKSHHFAYSFTPACSRSG
jgi:hypothetical protein